MHARSGGQFEIMGLMNGKIHDHTFYVLDAFALPVQGTETRVNAGDQAMEYMVQYTGGNEEIGKQELVVGWYHRWARERRRVKTARIDALVVLRSVTPAMDAGFPGSTSTRSRYSRDTVIRIWLSWWVPEMGGAGNGAFG